MFSLLSGLWQYLFSPQHFHVLIIGLDSAGKTTLLENIKNRYGTGGLPADKITPTIGMNLAKIKYQRAQIIFWDLGGQSKMRSMWEKYYMEANAVLFVVDSFNVERINEAKDALDHILQDNSLLHTPILILANKQDLQGALTPMELSSTFSSVTMARNTTGMASYEQRIFGVSAMTSHGLDECMSAVLRECRLHKCRVQSD